MSAARRIAWRDNPTRKRKRLTRKLARAMNLPYRILADASLVNHWSDWTWSPPDPRHDTYDMIGLGPAEATYLDAR